MREKQPPKFVKGAYFFRSDSILIESTKPTDLLCFSCLKIIIDTVLKFKSQNICIGENKYAKNVVLKSILIDFCNNATVTVHE